MRLTRNSAAVHWQEWHEAFHKEEEVNWSSGFHQAFAGHQVHHQPPIVPRDEQASVPDRPVAFGPGPALSDRTVAPKHHPPVVVGGNKQPEALPEPRSLAAG